MIRFLLQHVGCNYQDVLVDFYLDKEYMGLDDSSSAEDSNNQDIENVMEDLLYQQEAWVDDLL